MGTDEAVKMKGEEFLGRKLTSARECDLRDEGDLMTSVILKR